MTSLLSRVLPRKAPARSSRPHAQLRPTVDGLERRELLTGVPVVNQVGAMVQIIPAADQDNTATLTRVGNQLNVDINGTDWYFDASQIQHVVFDASQALAGTQQTWINETFVVSTAYSGAGTNHFVAGHGTDVFIAMRGTTVVDARDGYVIFQAFGAATNSTFNEGSGSGMVMLFQGATTQAAKGAGAYYYHRF